MQTDNIRSACAGGAYGVQSADRLAEMRKKEPLPEEEKLSRGRDKYVPSEEEKPIGLYSVSEDENGVPAVKFDMAEAPAEKTEDGDGSEKSESCTCNTDRVDREIEKLREKQEQLEQKLHSAEGERAEQIKKQLESVSAELALKDNDTYRRQNAVFS